MRTSFPTATYLLVLFLCASNTSTLNFAVHSLPLTPITPTTPYVPSEYFFSTDGTTSWPSDTQGDLEGVVLFAQNQIIPSTARIPGSEGTVASLTALRTTLVMFQPTSASGVNPSYDIQMEVKE
eukprot:PhF_6_TR39639/c0_g1_i1/m.58769